MKDEWSNEKLTTKLKILCSSVKELKTMRKWVYGAMAIFSICAIIVVGIRADVKDANAGVEKVRESHIAEYRDLEATMRSELRSVENNVNKALFGITKDLGRNEASHIRLSQQLSGIEKQLTEIAKWQMEQK